MSVPSSTYKDPDWLHIVTLLFASGGGTIGAAIADTRMHQRLDTPPGWVFVGIGVVVGLAAGLFISFRVSDRLRARHQKKIAAFKLRQLANLDRDLKLRAEVIRTARAQYPECIDEDSLTDEGVEGAWPKYLFAELFVVPDVVIPYKTDRGFDDEVRLWSRALVEENKRDDSYQEHLQMIEEERRMYAEDARQAQEERDHERELARQEAEAEREQSEKLAKRKASQIVMPFENLRDDRGKT